MGEFGRIFGACPRIFIISGDGHSLRFPAEAELGLGVPGVRSTAWLLFFKNPHPPDAKHDELHGRLSSCFSTVLSVMRGCVATESHALACNSLAKRRLTPAPLSLHSASQKTCPTEGSVTRNKRAPRRPVASRRQRSTVGCLGCANILVSRCARTVVRAGVEADAALFATRCFFMMNFSCRLNFLPRQRNDPPALF